MKLTLKTAVVGVGHFGRHHARIYSQLPDVELVAVADLERERADEVAGRTGTRAVTDYRQLLGSVDAVSVATPASTHFEVARDFLVSGASVLVEKPMTTSVSQARQLVDLARAHNRVLQVGYVSRFAPVLSALADLHVNPRFIESHRLASFALRTVDVGVVLDLMVHDLDLVLSMVPAELERVESVGLPILGATEDIANARLTFSDGCVANLTAGRLALSPMRRMRIFSPDSFVSLDFESNRATIVHRRPDFSLGSLTRDTLRDLPPERLREFLFSNCLEMRQLVLETPDEPLRRELESFINSVRTGREPVVSGQASLRTLHAAEQILRSLRNPSL